MTLIWNKLIKYYQKPQLLQEPAPDQESVFTYRDFLEEYPGRIRKHTNEKAIEHWENRQQAETLPLYGRSPELASTAATRVTIELTNESLDKIDSLLSETPFKTFNRSMGHYQFFLSVLVAWLKSATSHNKLTINMPNGGRFSKEDKQCIGYFIEILPFQIKLEDDSSFETVYKEVQQESMRLIRHAKSGACRYNDGTRPNVFYNYINCLLYTSPSPRDATLSRMPSSA